MQIYEISRNLTTVFVSQVVSSFQNSAVYLVHLHLKEMDVMTLVADALEVFQRVFFRIKAYSHSSEIEVIREESIHKMVQTLNTDKLT